MYLKSLNNKSIAIEVFDVSFNQRGTPAKKKSELGRCTLVKVKSDRIIVHFLE